MRTISWLILAVLSTVLVPIANGQVARVVLETSGCSAHDNYVNVYEYDFVDVRPEFPGEDRGLINYNNETRKYPYEAYKHRIEGRVLCSFVVNTDGSVCNVSVLKGVCPSIDKEAVRIIREMPSWKPGKMGEEVVPVHCIIPVAFRL